MSTNKSTKNILKEIDIIKDRDYVLSELKKSELEKSY
jgi:tRNA U34 2-thiouridine synthase MnmA/TrmU